MSPVLDVRDLTVVFDGAAMVKDVSFALEPGDAFAIVGPNGAGKSVILRALLGMIPYRGTIAWAPGIRIGYVPQKIDADRHLPINVKNLLRAKAATLGLPANDIEEIIGTVGLDEKILGTPVGHLSGGQFQRALIAFALLGKPSVLILDEPTASIDKQGEEQVYELVHRLQDSYEMTVIIVSHDLNFVYKYASKVLCVNREGLCFGPPDEVLTPEILEKIYGPHKYFHHFHHPEEEAMKHPHGHA